MKFALWLLFMITASQAIAQNAISGKANRTYVKGQLALKQGKPEAALKYFGASLKEDPANGQAYYALAHTYLYLQQYEKAAEVWDQAARACAKCMESYAFPLAQALVRARQYEKAGRVLSAYTPQGDRLGNDYQLLQKQIEFGRGMGRLERAPEPLHLSDRINGPYDEYFPSIDRSDSLLVFTRKTNGIDEDFYWAKRDSCGGWFRARDMGMPPNSSEQEGAQMLSADGHYLFFMRCGNRSPNGWERGGCDLYFSYTEGDGWAQPEPFGATINTPAFEGMPSLSSDNRELFFVSDRAGGYGGKDIWVSRFENGLWQVPENLGPTINTPFDETAPFIASDNVTLYFTSNGHGGMGGNDIYLSRRGPSGWQEPQNLGPPLNTEFEEVSLCLAPDGQKAYFSSNRPGGEGGMDLYEVVLPQWARPRPYTYIYGIVYDSIDGQRLPLAQIEWKDAASGEPLHRYHSNKGDASFMASIPLGKDFAVQVIRPGYADFIDTLRWDASRILSPDTLRIPLLSHDYEPPLGDTLLLRISFEKNVTALSDSLVDGIKELIAPYKDLHHVAFWANGHTDDSGTPSINESISYARAQWVADVLRGAGVREDQIQVQGWSDAFPLLPNDSDEHRKQNRRVELWVRRPVHDR